MNNLISKVAREVAGEINDPVTLIKGYVDLLERRIKAGETQHQTLEPLLREIQQNCRRAASIAESLQDLSFETFPDKLIFCGLEQIVERSLNLFSDKIRKSGIRLQIDHEKSKLQFWCHHLQIVQVLVCLLNQAIERVQSRTVRGIGVMTFFRIDERSKAFAVIRVQDSGVHQLVIPTVELCNPILLQIGGEVELVTSSLWSLS